MAFLKIVSKEINERDKEKKPVEITLVKKKGASIKHFIFDR